MDHHSLVQPMTPKEVITTRFNTITNLPAAVEHLARGGNCLPRDLGRGARWHSDP